MGLGSLSLRLDRPMPDGGFRSRSCVQIEVEMITLGVFADPIPGRRPGWPKFL